MNWLAHVHLSPPDVEFQLGNLLADVLRREPRGVMGPSFEAGRCCHTAIDRFTDTHPIVHRSKMRIIPSHRRYAGILVDMFYDHFLAKNWEQFHESTLRDFTRQFQTEATGRRHQLPEDGADLIEYLVREDRLYSYRKLDGIEAALQRMSLRLTMRWKKSVRLQDAVPPVRLDGEEMEKDFLEFFPQLMAYVASGEWWSARSSERDAAY
jgi:acyl carrier protein phosphodiesterase